MGYLGRTDNNIQVAVWDLGFRGGLGDIFLQ